jgi:hypothetical protein
VLCDIVDDLTFNIIHTSYINQSNVIYIGFINSGYIFRSVLNRLPAVSLNTSHVIEIF